MQIMQLLALLKSSTKKLQILEAKQYILDKKQKQKQLKDSTTNSMSSSKTTTQPLAEKWA